MKLASKPLASSSEKTRLNVSCEAIPLSIGRKRPQPIRLESRPLHHAHPVVGTTDYAAQRHQQQLIQWVRAVARVGVFQLHKRSQNSWWHILLSLFIGSHQKKLSSVNLHHGFDLRLRAIALGITPLHYTQLAPSPVSRMKRTPAA